ncbi:MAG: tetratricopeptide repeat protein [Bacteroidales bacterium]|nr:tetratricopeptide repeat protein [Bacteroidales bacterium]
MQHFHDKSTRIFTLIAVLLSLLFSCSSTKRVANISSTADPLSVEERNKYDNYFLEAVRMKEKGCHDAAFDLLNHCLDIHPNGAVALYEMAKYYFYIDQIDKGEEALKKAVEADPDNYWYKQTLAIFYQNKQQTDKAIAVLENMTLQFPSKTEPLIALIDLYNSTRDTDKMLTTLTRLEQLDGKSEHLSMQKVRILMSAGKNEDALAEMQALSSEYPYDLRYRNLLGDALLENNRPNEALAIYQQILAADSMYAPTLLSLATCYQKQGNDSLYKAQLDRILLSESVDGKSKESIMRQLIARSEQGYKDSIAISQMFIKVLSLKQEDTDLATLAVQYLLSKKMNAEATVVLNRMIEIDPECKSAHLQLLNFAINEQNMEDVIKICTPAIEYLPNALEFYYYMGIAHFQLKENDKALAVFKKALTQITPESDKDIVSDFYAIMGDIYHAKSNSSQAYEAYDSALVYKPDNIVVLNNYAYYLSCENKDLDKAEEMSDKAVRAEPANATYLDTYAWILFQKGRYAEARLYMDQTLQNDSKPGSVVLEHAGDVYWHSGSADESVGFWQKAIEAEDLPTRTDAEISLLKKKLAYKKYLTK